MSPVAITPPNEGEKVSDLTSQGIKHALEKSAPSQLKSASMTGSITVTPPSEPSSGSKEAVDAPLAELDASRVQCTYSDSPRAVPAVGSPEMASQKVCTDHMIQARWTVESGWDAPTLQPFGPISLAPTASCLHYATECFEGMKLYRGYDGKLRLFRPELNCNRMLMSTNRIALPAFPPKELLKLIVKLCATDGKKWLPKDRPGSFLYIRPTMIASDPALGVERPKEALLMVILCCFAPMGDMSGGIKLLASQDDTCRAWPGGFGYAKVGANYGPSLVAQGEARKRGYHQILWLFGEDCTVTEAGASNFFIVWRTKEGKLQLVTADLNEKIVLDGVTRRSILELTRAKLTAPSSDSDLEPLEIVERKFNIFEVEEAAKEGRIVEAFAAGTAWFVAPISQIHFRGKDIDIPMVKGDVGAYASIVRSWLKGIMWGQDGMESHEWGHVIEEQ
ncbi:branched-chain-amino-acid aminotransferas-like protein [Dothidotthia symphoricarpi CBS 119687]|uniref:Branched-chain-amino-acid aminotransferase n=1 Tax=Dothidotthia symphoricarpi CBS 119687 TaxID=1392245 RepID=A0A6A6A8E0_9PLEO|nr:branched-chain-amino-acid aminotransferas-like protein [Dothidotthia symphoricarpi CBS 119687]KAF2127344.1 branched-chain-amino-acid aminotransferas-like protein [Dothidotthia symphoricarpi CBS 119687]